MPKSKNSDPLRLNKYIAHAGVCSRRAAAELVKSGQIKVNGKVEINPAVLIGESDRVVYKGKTLKPVKKKIYLLLNKPKNVVTTLSDERGRRTVIDLIKDKVQVRVYPVGRLDRNTTGLLLLTNDGDMAKKLSHPSHGVKKIYEVGLDKNFKPSDMDKVKRGLTLEDGPVAVDAISYVRNKTKEFVGIEIHIGRNRIVRRIFEHLGYEVKTLDRVYYAGLTKKDLKRGWSRHLEQREIIMLRHFI